MFPGRSRRFLRGIMKLIYTKEVDISDARVTVSINLKTESSTINISYTCPGCGGHGCRRADTCGNSGTISMVLDPTQLDKNLDKETADKLRMIVGNLSNAMGRNYQSTSRRD